MKLRDITPDKFLETCLLNQYMPRMLLPEPFFTHTSIWALHTAWLYRKPVDYVFFKDRKNKK